MCTEAASKVKISPVGLEFFTLVSEDGSSTCILNPNKVLSEVDCGQVYSFKLCIKACHGIELRDFDKTAFEYYFHQVCVSLIYLYSFLKGFHDYNVNKGMAVAYNGQCSGHQLSCSGSCPSGGHWVIYEQDT